MIISQTAIIVMFVLLVVSIIGNAAFIGLYVSIWNAERIVQYKRKQQEFDEQKERVEKNISSRKS